MKRATRTPNRFITSIQSWPAKGLALFLALLALGSCEDEIALIGSKRPTSRFGVYFKEFDIPVTTVQTDSVNSSASSTASQSDRLLCGVASDPNFGKISATLYTLFSSSGKLDKVDKSSFNVQAVTLNFVLRTDYYVYGDTANRTLDFTIHKITEPEYWIDDPHYTTTSVSYDPTAFATGSFTYVHDSITDHRERNNDTKTSDNPSDSLFFQLPISYGRQLLDSALAKGVYSRNSEGVSVYNAFKTDSVFKRAFPGFALVSASTNDRVLGFKSIPTGIQSTRITLYYSYVKEGKTYNARLYYFNYDPFTQTGQGTSEIVYDRSNTALAGLNSLAQDFNAPDDYCYLQSGTGLFTKLDLSAVYSYFDAAPIDTIRNMAINAAELVVEIEPEVNRQHLNLPSGLHLRVVNQGNRFFKMPLIDVNVNNQTVEIPNQIYATNYYCAPFGPLLDARDDESDRLVIPMVKITASPTYYKAYVSSFIQSLLRLPAGFPKIYSMALIPADAPYGKTLHGLSFKKDKVKLRVYYTKTL